MNNLTNYHSHCLYCDGVAPAEDFVKEAIAMGFSSYGISSHAPIPFESCWNMKQEKLTDYIVEINSLKEKYKNDIELYIGLEIDYLDKTYNPASSIFQTTPLDYRIGSVHFLKIGDEQFIDIDTSPEQFKITVETIFNGDIIKLVRHYFDTMVQMIETGGFDFIGHADKISMNALSYRQGITSEKWYNELIQDYFHFIAEKGSDNKYGARPLRRAIQSKIEDALANEILEGRVKRGDSVQVKLHKNEIAFEVKKQ